MHKEKPLSCCFYHVEERNLQKSVFEGSSPVWDHVIALLLLFLSSPPLLVINTCSKSIYLGLRGKEELMVWVQTDSFTMLNTSLKANFFHLQQVSPLLPSYVSLVTMDTHPTVVMTVHHKSTSVCSAIKMYFTDHRSPC